jgi:signal transduction histidine kinase
MAAPLSNGVRRSRARGAATIEEEVRRFVARELHDRVAQTLTGMLVDVENFKAEEVGWADVVQELDKMQSSTRQVLQNLRQLLHDLRGEATIERGFVDAVNALAQGFAAETKITVDVKCAPHWPTVITRQAYLNLHRIIEEALSNVRMHSGASHVEIRFEPYSESRFALILTDDGRGVAANSSRPMGLGTVGMKERAVLLGGELAIVSEFGVGTIIRAVFPKGSLVPKDVLPSTELLIRNEVPA